jgi:P4 family phage/plasmid primase-like protien
LGTPDDYVTLSTGYKYNDYSLDNEAVKGIEEMFRKMHVQQDMREYVLTLMASYLDGHTKEQKFILWTGTGSNGKSLSVEFMAAVLGDYSGVLPITFLTRKQGSSSQATPELAEMQGKRFVVFQEPEADDKIYVGHMKEMTGGDKIMARKLFGNPFYFSPQFKLLLTCNKLPYIPSTDGGTWRRLRVTQWESEFLDHDQKIENPKKQFFKDFSLKEKFEKWRPVMMWYLITKYYSKFKKEGIKEPKKVKQFTDKYRKDSDIYLEFMSDNITVTKSRKDYITLSELYKAFKDWYRESYNSNTCPPKKEMQEYLSSHDYDINRGDVLKMKFRDFDSRESDNHMELFD